MVQAPESLAAFVWADARVAAEPYIDQWDTMTGGALGTDSYKAFQNGQYKFLSLWTANQGVGMVYNGQIDPATFGPAVSYTLPTSNCFWNSVLLCSMLVVVIVPV